MKAQAALLGIALAVSSLAPGSPAAAQTPAPRTSVAFQNALPDTYELQRVRLWIDGQLRYDGPRPFDSPVAAGEHLVAVTAEYRLRDPVLTYVSGYHIEVHSSQRVSSSAPRAWVARVIEAGGVTTPLERRAAMVWR